MKKIAFLNILLLVAMVGAIVLSHKEKRVGK